MAVHLGSISDIQLKKEERIIKLKTASQYEDDFIWGE